MSTYRPNYIRPEKNYYRKNFYDKSKEKYLPEILQKCETKEESEKDTCKQKLLNGVQENF